MNAHSITLDLYDETARVVAIDFATRRVLVTWGSGLMSTTSGFEYRDRGYLRCSAPYQGCSLVAQASAGLREFRLRLCSPARPPQESSRPSGTRHVCRVFPSGRWHRFAASQTWGHWRKGRLVSLQDLGPCEDALFIAPKVPIRASAPCELSGLADWLRSLGAPATLTSSPLHLRALGAWLDAMRKKLVHGFDLTELAQEHHASPIDSARLDGILKPLVKLGVVRPYSFDPDYPNGLQTYTNMCGDVSSARSFAISLASEMREEKMRTGTPYTDDEWVALSNSLGVTASHTYKVALSAVGSIFWYFTQGPRFADMPHFVL